MITTLNNVVIESKGSQAALAWSSVHTESTDSATSLYPEKANERFSDVLTPRTWRKVSLDQVLVSQKKTLTFGRMFSVTPFDPSGSIA